MPACEGEGRGLVSTEGHFPKTFHVGWLDTQQLREQGETAALGATVELGAIVELGAAERAELGLSGRWGRTDEWNKCVRHRTMGTA